MQTGLWTENPFMTQLSRKEHNEIVKMLNK